MDCDVVIDATVSTSVATAIEIAQKDGRLKVPLVQIATDNETASLGILTVCQPQSDHTTNDIEDVVREHAQSLNRISPRSSDSGTNSHHPSPQRSAAPSQRFAALVPILSAIASTGLNLAAHALARSLSGGYLFAAPHSSYGVPARLDIAVDSNP